MKNITLSLGFSPCPNDTFIFDALVNNRIDTKGIHFKVFIEDVETLNRRALKTELDITKLSFAAFARVQDQYALLDSGSALGFGVGPLVISKEKNYILTPQSRIAIPGELTTAHYLFKLFYPEVILLKEYMFNEIENAVLSGAVDAGVIIHENRFTYAQRKLHKVRDLGEAWETYSGSAIPLGGIVVKKHFAPELKHKINSLVAQSVAFAFSQPEQSENFIRDNAQAMDASVRRQHIALYVNEFSKSLGELGESAVRKLFQNTNNDYTQSQKNFLEIIK